MLDAGFNYADNKITSLKHCPEYIGSDLVVCENNLKSITVDVFPKDLNGRFICDADGELKKYNRLKGKDILVILEEEKENDILKNMIKNQVRTNNAKEDDALLKI